MTMTPTEQRERSDRLGRLRARVGNSIVDQLLRAHRFDAESETPADLSRAMEEVENWTPDRLAPTPFRIHNISRVAPEQFFSGNCPGALTALADPIRAGPANGETADTVCQSLLTLAAKAYPVLLAQTERNLAATEERWAPLRLRGDRPHEPPSSEYAAAVEALCEEPCLRGLFENGAVGLQTTFGRYENGLRAYEPAELILYGAWRLALLRGAWDAASFRTAVVEQIGRVRAAAEGRPVNVPIFCGFARTNIEKAFEAAGGIFRPYVGDIQNCLFDHVDRLDGSYHASGFVVERSHTWRCRSLTPADAKNKEVHDLGSLDWSGVGRWADRLAVAAAAVQVGDKLRPHDLQHAQPFAGIPELLWIQTADPLYGAVSLHLSREWASHDKNAPALTRQTAEYVRELENVSDESFQIAIRRVRMALDQSRRWEDALVDAVIAWEALCGDCRGSVTLMTTGFLAKLISEPSHRHQLRKALKDLYGRRCKVVHGGALDEPNVRVWRDQAVTVAVVALKQLCGPHQSLLEHLNRFERFCLDEGGELGSR